MDDVLLTVPEAAAVLRRPLGTLSYWRSTGQGPAWFKLGRGVVYRRSALEAFIAQAESASKAGPEAS